MQLPPAQQCLVQLLQEHLLREQLASLLEVLVFLVRLANPQSRLEAKTSRPKLLNAVGKLTSHARVNKIVLVLTHEAATQIKAMIANVRAGVEHIRGAAPQLTSPQSWYVLARYIADKILAFVPNTHIPTPAATG